MQEDLRLSWMEPRAMRARVYGQRDALTYGGVLALVACGLAFTCVTGLAAGRGWSFGVLVRRRVAHVVAIGLLVGLGRYITLDVVPVREVSRREFVKPIVSLSMHRWALSEFSTRYGDFFGTPSREIRPGLAFPEAYEALLKDSTNSHAYATPTETTNLHWPGDYHIETTDDGWRLTILDRDCVPVTVLIAPDGAPKPSGT
jgi:hypothetical protein